MSDGDIIIECIIEANAIQSSVVVDGGATIFVWSANAAEQIEGALANKGLCLSHGTSSVPCSYCGGDVVEFVIPNKSWNTLIRRDGKEHDQEYLCLFCFSEKAAEYVRELRSINDALKTALAAYQTTKP